MERLQQLPDFLFPAIELFGNLKGERDILARQFKRFDLSRAFQLARAEFQVGLQPGGRLVTFLGVFPQQLQDDVGQYRRQFRVESVRRHGESGDVAIDQVHGIGGLERQLAREHLIKRHAQRIKVCAVIQRPVHPARLFRRNMGERPLEGLRILQGGPFGGKPGGDAHIDEMHHARRRVPKKRRGLNVFVDNVGGMKCSHAPGDLDAHGKRLTQSQTAFFKSRCERYALQSIHREDITIPMC